jgi:hypothetical protein
MKYKILPRRVTLLIFNDKDPINYSAACQININGTHGTIDTLIGKDFYRFLEEKGYKPFKDLGLEEICAAVTPAHCRLIQRRLKSINTIQVTEIEEPEENTPGLKLCWLRMTEKSPLE